MLGKAKEKRNQKNHGITVVELLAVTLIIGIMVLTIIPIFTKFGINTRLISAAEHVKTLMKMAQTLATYKNIEHRMWIYPRTANPANRIYLVYTDPSTSAMTHAEKVWTAPQGTEIPDVTGNTAAYNINFNPPGTVGPTGSVHLIVKGTQINGSDYDPTASYVALGKDDRVKCYTVAVTGTGMITLYEYGRSTPWNATDL